MLHTAVPPETPHQQLRGVQPALGDHTCNVPGQVAVGRAAGTTVRAPGRVHGPHLGLRRAEGTECLASYVQFLDRVRREVQNDLHVVRAVRQHISILLQGYPSGQHSFKPCGVRSRQRGRGL